MKRQRCAFTTPEQPADDMTTYLGLLQRRVEILSSAPPGMKLSQTENGDHFPQPPSTMVFRLSTSVKDVLLMSGHRLSWHSYRQRSQKVVSHYQHGVAAYGHVVSHHKHGVVAHGHFLFLNNTRPGSATEKTVLKCNHSSSARQRSQNVISHYQHGVAAYGHFRFLNNACPGTARETTMLKCSKSSSAQCYCVWTLPFPEQRPALAHL